MKKKLLFSTVATFCVSLVAGCGGDPTYQITAVPNSAEKGLVEGSGRYKIGDKVTLKAYPNVGCGGVPTLNFKKQNEHNFGADNEPFSMVAADVLEGQPGYYYAEFNLTEENVGTYQLTFECSTNEEGNAADDMFKEFTVNYVMVDDDNNPMSTQPTIIDNTGVDGLEDNQQKIASGRRLTELKYIDSINDEIIWHVKDTKGTDDVADDTYEAFNFENSIREDMTLYGKKAGKEAKELVASAVEKFGQTSKLVAMHIEEEKTATIVEDSGVKSFTLGGVTYTLGEGVLTYQVSGEDKTIEIDENNVFVIGDRSYYMVSDGVYGFSEIARIANLDKGLDSKELLVVVTNVVRGAANYAKQQNNVYVRNSMNDLWSVFKLGEVDPTNEDTAGNSGFKFENIQEMFKFVEASAIDVEAYDITVETEQVMVGKRLCFVYKIKKDGSPYMNLYINKGIIYKTEDANGQEFLMNYSVDNVPGVDMQGKENNMYFVELSSDNETLNGALGAINGNYTDALKIVPAYGDNIEDLIDNQLRDKLDLQNYDYTLHKWNKEASTSGDDIYYDTPYNGEYISYNDKFLIKVNASIGGVMEALETLKSGGIKLSTTVVLESGFTVNPVIKDIEAGVNPLETTDGLLDVVKDSFADLNGILTDSASSFHHFKYSTSEGEGVYKFYESRNDNVPFIIVNVKDGKVVSFSTFYNGNTYVTTITALSAE